MTKKKTADDKHLEIYIFICLVQQMEAYSYAFNDILKYEGKYRLKKLQFEAKQLMKIIENSIDSDKLADDAEIFDKVLRKIYDSTGVEKMQLYDLMHAWVNGHVKVEEA